MSEPPPIHVGGLDSVTALVGGVRHAAPEAAPATVRLPPLRLTHAVSAGSKTASLHRDIGTSDRVYRSTRRRPGHRAVVPACGSAPWDGRDAELSVICQDPVRSPLGGLYRLNQNVLS